MCVLVPLSLLGLLMIAVNLLLFSAPLAEVGKVLRTKDASPLPFAIVSASMVNNAMWSIYGVMIRNNAVMIPSVVGYLLAGFQLLLVAWCRDYLPLDLSVWARLTPSTCWMECNPHINPAVLVQGKRRWMKKKSGVKEHPPESTGLTTRYGRVQSFDVEFE
mmetsp:Transcript_52731/g.119878  ORF Transcript_52731/g.119878 Transcript_52731/m.119878 type:complete len:161 (-) Transcript_52731:220-702(-)